MNAGAADLPEEKELPPGLTELIRSVRATHDREGQDAWWAAYWRAGEDEDERRALRAQLVRS